MIKTPHELLVKNVGWSSFDQETHVNGSELTDLHVNAFQKINLLKKKEVSSCH